MRKEAEKFYGIAVNHNPCKQKYAPIDFSNAAFPPLPQYMPDDSSDFMKPIAAAGFLTEDYNLTVGGRKIK